MRRLILGLTLPALVLAACAASTPAPAATGVPSATPAASAAPSSNAGPNILPIFISSEILAGQNRFLFSLTDRANQVIAAPDVPVALEFYDVAADPEKVVFTADLPEPSAEPEGKGGRRKGKK